MPKARAKNGFYLMIVHFIFVDNTILDINFSYGLEPVLIHRILIGFE